MKTHTITLAVLVVMSAFIEGVAASSATTYVIDSTTDKLPPITVCTGVVKAVQPLPSDPLSAFPSGNGPRLIFMRSDAAVIALNIRNAVEADPELSALPQWQPEWTSAQHWETVAPCDLTQTPADE